LSNPISDPAVQIHRLVDAVEDDQRGRRVEQDGERGRVDSFCWADEPQPVKNDLVGHVQRL
jgi:hypothetical protein